MKSLADPTRLRPIDKKDGLLQVIIETPAGSRNKFAFDPDQGVFALKNVLPAGMTAGEYEACGARCALIPVALMVAGLHAQAELLKDMLASGTPKTYLSRQNGIKATAEFYNRQGET